MAIVKKNIGTSEVEMGSSRDFDTYELLMNRVGKIGPFDIYRGVAGFTLVHKDGLEMRINLKGLLTACAEELAAEMERRTASDFGLASDGYPENWTKDDG